MKIVRLILSWKYLLVLPHLCFFACIGEKEKQLIVEDVEEMNKRLKTCKNLAYYLLFWKPYRNLFYHRMGSRLGYILSLFLPPYENFTISCKHIEGGGICSKSSIFIYYQCKEYWQKFYNLPTNDNR